MSVSFPSYGISSNNSHPSVNHLPWIIRPPKTEIFKIITALTSLTIFSSFYPLPVKLKCNVIRQNWSVTIQALKINQGTKFGMHKKAMFGLFDVIFWFYGKIKQLRVRAWLPVSNIILKQSPPFCTKKRNNRPPLSFEKICYFVW